MIIERYRWRVYRHNWSAINGHSGHNGLLIGFNVKGNFVAIKLISIFFCKYATSAWNFSENFSTRYAYFFRMLIEMSTYRKNMMLYHLYWSCKFILIWFNNFYFINSYVIFLYSFIFFSNFINISLLSIHISIVKEFCSSKRECYSIEWSIYLFQFTMR